MLRRRKAAFFGVVLGVAMTCAPDAAEAESEAAAKEIVDKAIAQYNLGHFDESSVLFEKAYQLDPAPILLFNIAQCHRRLGNNERALFFYRRYLEQAPANAPERADVNKRVADLEQSIRDQADLKNKPPPGVGRDVSPGAPTDGGRATIPPVPPPVVPPPPEMVPDQNEDDSRRTLRRVAWVAGGLAAGSLVFAGVEAVIWSKRADRFDNNVGGTSADPSASSRNCGVDEPNRGGPGCAALYEDVSSARTLTIVGLATGGLLAAGSAVLFLMSASNEASPTAMGPVCIPNLYSPGVMCRLSF